MFRPVATASALLALAASTWAAGQSPAPAGALAAAIDAGRDRYAQIAREIWGFAELGYQESRSSALLQRALADAGFTIRQGVAGMPTAFVASYGSGKPVGVAEISKKRLHVKGAVGYAHSGDPTKADSQIYITLQPRPDLDGQLERLYRHRTVVHSCPRRPNGLQPLPL